MIVHPMPPGSGWIEVVTGCMFSGKTEELIRRLVRAQIAKQEVLVFKPAVDVRYEPYESPNGNANANEEANDVRSRQ